MIEIDSRISIPEEELRFTASLSSGPGGQNVNKVSSRVTLWFDVARSPSLSMEVKELIMSRLASRINKDGVLRVVSQQTRSQAANREVAVARLVTLLRDAVKREKPRKRTGVSRKAKEKRLEEKKHHSDVKRARSGKISLDD